MDMPSLLMDNMKLVFLTCAAFGKGKEEEYPYEVWTSGAISMFSVRDVEGIDIYLRHKKIEKEDIKYHYSFTRLNYLKSSDLLAELLSIFSSHRND